MSGTVTASTLAIANAVRALRFFAAIRPSSDRSSTSPATLDQSHAVGRGRARMPKPCVSSRAPIRRIRRGARPSSLAPTTLQSTPGTASCVVPSPTLNQPRNSASGSLSRTRTWTAIRPPLLVLVSLVLPVGLVRKHAVAVGRSGDATRALASTLDGAAAPPDRQEARDERDGDDRRPRDRAGRAG